MNQSLNMNRREFLLSAAAASAGMGLFVEELNAEASEAFQAAQAGPPVGCAVIGLGPQGREILAVLAKIPNASVQVICDTYNVPGFVKRAQDIAPKANFVTDYKQALSNPAVSAVFVATPSYLHKQIALDALAAGKHVYCEAPVATNLDDAKAICQAGAAAKTVFQPGLQNRSNKMHNHVLNFVRSQAMGKVAEARAFWHKKTSWRFAAPTPDREKELNWRISKATSLGLPGEVGVHAFDVANWYFKALPVSVTAFGGIYFWNKDGRDVDDTVQCILEYPGGIRFLYDATLVSSFDGSQEVFMGSDSAILIRDQRGWMFKESDAPLLGWEVYATKDKMGVGPDSTGTGVALVADATKLLAAGQEPAKVGTDITKSALYYAVSNFLANTKGAKLPAATAEDGYAANVIAAKVQDAIASGSKITFQKEWFTL